MAAAVPMAIGMGSMSYMQARSQNRAIGKSMRSARTGALVRLDSLMDQRDVTEDQLTDQAEVDQWKVYQQSLQVGGTARANAAARGTTTSMEGSGKRVLTQSFIDRFINAGLINRSMINTITRLNSDYMAGAIETQSSYNAQIASLQSQMTNPFMAGVMGGISGYSTGLNIQTQQAQLDAIA
jgi:hypothetical protein